MFRPYSLACLSPPSANNIRKLLDLYRDGQLKLDELVTRRYRLEEINQGYDDLLAGKNVRGVIIHEH